MKLFLSLLLLLPLAGVVAAGSYTDREAAGHSGEKAEVHGKIHDVHVADSGMILLNFGGKYPAQTFTAVIPAVIASHFPHSEKLIGATVSVNGLITVHKNRHELVLNSPQQFKVLSAAASKPRETSDSSPSSDARQASATITGPDGVTRRLLPMSRAAATPSN